MFAHIWGFNSHLIELLSNHGGSVDAESCSFPDVDVETAHCCILVVQIYDRLDVTRSLSSAKRIGPTVKLLSVLYIKFL